MGDIVADGTTFSCPLCTGQPKISVLVSSAEGNSKKLANAGNFLFPPPAGAQCLLIPNAPAPCAPPSVSVIDPGQTSVDIDGKKALGAGCKLQCAKSGLLTVSSSSQSAAQHGGAESGPSVAAIAAAAVASAAQHKEEKLKEKDKPSEKETHDEIQKDLDQSRKRINNSKQHLKGGPKGELQASLKELKGEVVCRKASGEPFNHVNEVRETQQKLKKTIEVLKKKVINNKNASSTQIKEGEKLLSEASRILDHSEGFVPSISFKNMKGR